VRVRTVREVGAVIKGERRRRGWTQARLAEAAGVTRAWVIAVESGKPTVELSLVLRTLAALDLVADVVPVTAESNVVDLDELLGRSRG